MLYVFFVILRVLNIKSGSTEAPYDWNTWLGFWKWKSVCSVKMMTLDKSPQTQVTCDIAIKNENNPVSVISVIIRPRWCNLGLIWENMIYNLFSSIQGCSNGVCAWMFVWMFFFFTNVPQGLFIIIYRKHIEQWSFSIYEMWILIKTTFGTTLKQLFVQLQLHVADKNISLFLLHFISIVL